MTTTGAGDGPGGAPLREVLEQLGVEPEAIERADSEGTLDLLLVERVVVPEPPHLDIDDVARRTGLAVEDVARIWHSLGFPDPHTGEKLFSETDVDILRNVADLIARGVLSHQAVLQMSRVIGSSLSRVAQAQVDAIAFTSMGDADGGIKLEPLAANAGALLPTVPRVLESVWRRHLQGAARRRLARTVGGEHAAVVGFADLVGFTALSQQVSDAELASIVELFETLAYDVVAAEGGRVVKTIGDEVMFLVDEPVAAADIALSLADASREADELSDVRVGMAMGPVLEREGDCFGATVNLASRATTIAYPGTVVVSADLREALATVERFSWRAMRPRYLKNIGRTQLWVLRRAEVGFESRFAERRRALREAVRARVEATLAGDSGS